MNIQQIKVRNMRSSNGNLVPNQFIIEVGMDSYFQSYDSIIIAKVDGIITLDETYWDYSRTTGKYRNLFLGENKAETQRKINSGEYKLSNLN